MKRYTVSIVIPTHNRSASLIRLLDALSKQTYPLKEIEVIVVANGCTDRTTEILKQIQTPFKLKIIEQSDQGPAGARNNGAGQAEGRLLIFLDDDVEPSSTLVESFVAAHTSYPGKIAIGYLHPKIDGKQDFLSKELRRWWEDKFNAMRELGHRFSYHELLSGNLSIEYEKFRKFGGFDTKFRACLDDSEFGFRLLKSGASFMFIENAKGDHHENRNLRGGYVRKYNEGQAEVLLAQKHPELRSVLSLSRIQDFSTISQHLILTLAFNLPRIGDTVSETLHRLLFILEWLCLRRPWRTILNILMIYWYLRGVADKLGSKKAYLNLLNEEMILEGDESVIEIDLAQGFEVAEQRIDEEHPKGLKLHYGKHEIGTLNPYPGVESLRGNHLRPILAKYFQFQILKALAREGLVEDKLGAARLLEFGGGFLPVDLGKDNE